jgi:hypothetical protein
MISNLKVVKNGPELTVSYIEDGRVIRAKMIENSLIKYNEVLNLLRTFIHFNNGVIHREDGPAVEHSNGIKLWFLNGKEYSFDEYWSIQLKTEIGQQTFVKFFGTNE